VDDCEHKHGKEFKKIALSLGMIGPMCWRRLNLDSECRFFLDRGLVANIWVVGC